MQEENCNSIICFRILVGFTHFSDASFFPLCVLRSNHIKHSYQSLCKFYLNSTLPVLTAEAQPFATKYDSCLKL